MNKKLALVLGMLFFLVLCTSVTKADKVTADMHCVPASIEPKGTIMCTIDFKLLNPNETATLKLKKVYLGDKEIWPEGPPPGTVTVVDPSLTLNPHDIEESITIVLTFNDEMADHYFGRPVIGNYLDKFGDREYTITAEIDGISHSLSTQVEVKNRKWEPVKEALGYLFLIAVLLVTAGVPSTRGNTYGPLVLVTFSGFMGIYIARIGSGLQWNLKHEYWPPDTPSLILMIPIAAIHILSYKWDRKIWKPIFTALLWFFMIIAAKYGSNKDVVAIVLSLTLWVVMELVSIVSRQPEAGKKVLIPLILAPYMVLISYYLLVGVSGFTFWIISVLILTIGVLLVNLSYSVRGEGHLALMYPAMLMLFMVTHSLYSLAYGVPLLGISFFLLKWNNQNSKTHLTT